MSELTKDDLLKKKAGTENGIVKNSFGATTSTTNAPIKTNAPAQSGKFTNVQSLIKANQGGGSRLADATTAGVQRGVEMAKGEVGQFGQKIGQEVGKEEARVKDVNPVKEAIEAAKKPTPLNAPAANTNQQQASQGETAQQSAVANPFALVDNEAQFNAARDLITGTTNVAAITENKDAAFGKADRLLTDVGREASQLGTEEGRFNLLRRAVGGPMYSRGMGALDNLLMSTEGSGKLQNQLVKSRDDLAAGNRNLTTTADQFKTRLDTVAADAGDLSTKLKADLESGITGVNKELTDQFDTASQAAKKEAGILNQVLSGSANLDDKEVQDVIKKYNVDLDANLFGLTPGSFLKTANDPKLTRESIINEEQARRLAALQRLSGMGKDQVAKKGDRTAEELFAKYDTEGLNKARQAELDRTLKEYNKNINEYALTGRASANLSNIIKNIIDNNMNVDLNRLNRDQINFTSGDFFDVGERFATNQDRAVNNALNRIRSELNSVIKNQRSIRSMSKK